jgi:hypothetical protein
MIKAALEIYNPYYNMSEFAIVYANIFDFVDFDFDGFKKIIEYLNDEMVFYPSIMT